MTIISLGFQNERNKRKKQKKKYDDDDEHKAMNFSLHYGHTVAYCTHKPFTRRILEFAVRCYIDFSDISEQSEFVIGMAGTIEHRPCDSWPFNTIPFFNIEANYVDFELIYYLLYLVVFILRSKFHFFFFLFIFHRFVRLYSDILLYLSV